MHGIASRVPENRPAHGMQNTPALSAILSTLAVAADFFLFRFLVLLPSGRRSLCPAKPIKAFIVLCLAVMQPAKKAGSPPAGFPALAKHKDVLYVTLCPGTHAILLQVYAAAFYIIPPPPVVSFIASQKPAGNKPYAHPPPGAPQKNRHPNNSYNGLIQA